MTLADFALDPEHGPPLRFRGRQLARVSSDDGSEFRRRTHYRIELYETENGRIVGCKVRVEDGKARTFARVFEAAKPCQDWLGFDKLQLEAYAAAGWPL